MAHSSRLGEAHEPRPGELDELACHLVLVVAVRCERHRSACDAQGTTCMRSSLADRCEIRCCGHAYADD